MRRTRDIPNERGLRRTGARCPPRCAPPTAALCFRKHASPKTKALVLIPICG